MRPGRKGFFIRAGLSKFVQENPKALSVKVERRTGGLVRVTIIRFLDKPRYLSAMLKVQEGEAVLFESRFASAVSETSVTYEFAVPEKHLTGAGFLLGESGFNMRDGVAIPWIGGEVYHIRLQEFLLKQDGSSMK